MPQGGRLAVEPLVDVFGTAEGFDDAQAMDRFLDGRRDVAGLVLDGAGDLDVATLVPQTQPDNGDRRDEDDDAQRPVHPQQQDRHDDDLEGVHNDEQQAESEEAAPRRQVVHDAAEQLTRLPLGVEAQR